MAWGDTTAEAVVIGPRAGYTVTMSNFARFSGDGYEQPMRDVIGALPNWTPLPGRTPPGRFSAAR